jgi:hypothetical protein
MALPRAGREVRGCAGALPARLAPRTKGFERMRRISRIGRIGRIGVRGCPPRPKEAFQGRQRGALAPRGAIRLIPSIRVIRMNPPFLMPARASNRSARSTRRQPGEHAEPKGLAAGRSKPRCRPQDLPLESWMERTGAPARAPRPGEQSSALSALLPRPPRQSVAVRARAGRDQSRSTGRHARRSAMSACAISRSSPVSTSRGGRTLSVPRPTAACTSLMSCTNFGTVSMRSSGRNHS